jgi:hypothetical protein
MMKSLKGGKRQAGPDGARALTVDEIRVVADLRIMHSKVDELYQVCKILQQRHHEGDVINYADKRVLPEDIRKVDELYLWFVKLREEAERRLRRANSR